MIGAGVLLRILRRSSGHLLDRFGILPSRYYLREALEALSKDDMPRVIHSLERSGGDRDRRWELIRQQAVFRCRVLQERHTQTLKRLEELYQNGGVAKTPDHQLKEALDLHRLAVRLLSNHEAHLQGLHSPPAPS